MATSGLDRLGAKLYVLLGLLFVGINGEKKVNLADIERDNLRSEGISKSGVARPEGTKYLTKPEYNQQQYQLPSQYNRPINTPNAYVTAPPSQNAPETYIQSNKYILREPIYQQQNNVPPEQSPESQYYNEYQQSPSSSKDISPSIYESQQLIYQPEVVVGNQLQATQQKTVTAKYAKNVNKETVYVDIPMMHLLAYYPNLNGNPGKSSGLLVPQLTTAATEQISIPLYTSPLNQKPIVPVKPTYQIQYASKYNGAVQPTFTTKALKGTVYATPVTPKKYTSAPLVNVPTYVPSDQSLAQGRQFLYTQAYIAPPHPQYVSQLVYTQPATVYMHATPVYNDVYARAPAYSQDNSLHTNVNYNGPPEQLETSVPIADELPNQVLTQQTSQSVAQNYVKDPEEPSDDLVPPQLPPQDFKSGVTSLLPVPSQEDEPLPVQNHVVPTEPRSLLDSYIPSNVIVAQDSARYQERPIKLESGFLPSKENFLYKKRKAE
ncbi:PREDICTED: uncharacterized protein LOC107194372 [Dufourea novaeangliae]|uniref:uncharacterized protein LOC107194372 n=1 Tax=Dufourea novaeangliae TaxID=178035 RepID=UPI0007674ABE|nr:PREDICTED: uncharacterized protein LOC107194372 [Dufourea novaeangliae]